MAVESLTLPRARIASSDIRSPLSSHACAPSCRDFERYHNAIEVKTYQGLNGCHYAVIV